MLSLVVVSASQPLRCHDYHIESDLNLDDYSRLNCLLAV